MPRNVLALLVLLLPASPAAAAEPGALVARYGFDAGQTADDSGNGHTLRAVGPGQLSRVPHDAGSAVGFPAGCCAPVVLETASSPALNPGRAAFSYGASVRLTAEETSPGSNVVQKGYATSSGGEWKLQVDGYAGRPSCVLVGAGARTRYVALAGRSVADGHWHQLTCRRTATRLSLAVDGTVAAVHPIPATLTVANAVPMRIGGKGVGPDNDQYHGDVDDVFVQRN